MVGGVEEGTVAKGLGFFFWMRQCGLKEEFVFPLRRVVRNVVLPFLRKVPSDPACSFRLIRNNKKTNI